MDFSRTVAYLPCYKYVNLSMVWEEYGDRFNSSGLCEQQLSFKLQCIQYYINTIAQLWFDFWNLMTWLSFALHFDKIASTAEIRNVLGSFNIQIVFCFIYHPLKSLAFAYRLLTSIAVIQLSNPHWPYKFPCLFNTSTQMPSIATLFLITCSFVPPHYSTYHHLHSIILTHYLPLDNRQTTNWHQMQSLSWFCHHLPSHASI